ncbi:MAG: InlB B-repeat-containing protein [Luteolibacter sp.]
MKRMHLALAALALALFSPSTFAQDTIADILSDPALNIDRPADRAVAVQRIRAIEMANRDRAHQKARAMGVPIRHVQANGTVTEIMGLDENGEFLIYTTHNANAAISSAANLVYPTPYNLDGTGVTVGVWDENAVRVTHTEFQTGSGSRVTVRDGATTLSSHATHVAGTVGARGASATRKGMAPNAFIDSYNWTSDNSEMTAAGASSAQQAGKIPISNHSYGFATGWRWNGSNWQWLGTGTDQNAYASQFGQYTTQARDWDTIAFNAPYYLIFKSAGNDNSNNPANGNQVIIGSNTVTYDRAIHPPGNGLYRNTTTNSANGYENISHGGNAKNIMTIGAANDAVTSGLRDPAKSTLTGFSSRGPTDDGRIKPDIVANGASLDSTEFTSDTAYSVKSGTSMSSPSAAGSAALLVQLYRNLFPGGDMRASTLKGLIIHTATDIGNPGPDYHYGWGLMNTKEAADLIIDHHANPSKNRMIEDQITTSVNSKVYSFAWDGSSPIRATLSWTDPAGFATSTHDLRSARLINDLDLKIIAPDGTQHYPYVMPFVGTWTVASMSANATTGVNSTDNVEQVLIPNPNQSGVWQAVVNHKGNLTNNQQRYSLLFSGVSDGIVPLALESITPNTGTVGTTVTVDIVGTALSADTAIRLRQPGRTDIVGTSVQMLNDTTLRCQFNLTGAASGAWNLVATNPDAETYTLEDAFTISGSLTTLWSESFDGASAPTGWTTTAQQGTNSWNIVTTASHSPTQSYFATGPGSTSITHLTSPQITMPASATNLSLEFWHRFNLQADRDCGKFYLSTDNGASWFEVTSANSGVAFTLNGYNSTMATNGQTNPFAGQQGWSGTTNSSFVRTTVNFTDLAKFTGTGKTLRLRWTIATNGNQSSEGWWVDSIAMLSDSSVPNQPPAITVAAITDTAEFQSDGPTTWHVLRGTSANLSVTATDDAGEEFLEYTWVATGPAPVTYSLNGENAAKTTTATFSAVGDYAITVNVLDTGGLSATSTVNVRVLPTSEFVVTPESSIMSVGDTLQFAANVIDQFGTPLATQPSPITWSTDGGGTLNATGLFTATTVGGPYTIIASGGGESGTAEVTINATLAGIVLENLNQTYNVSPRVVTATTTPAGLPYSITYDSSSTAPTNAGSYAINANITDPNYEGSTTGTLVVAKAAQTITFAPLAPVGNDQEPFALTATASSGLPVSYSSSNPSVAIVSGSTITVIGSGTTTITASQVGDHNYLPAPNLNQDLEVVPVVPTANTGGPYKVLIGQSLVLNGSASSPSFGESLTAYDWDLNNDGTFGDVTGVTPTAIPFDDLVNLWGMQQGFNTIQLRVTDSAAKTSTASTTVELVLSLQWDANGTTAGQTNGGGAWLGNNLWWDGTANVNWASGSNAVFGGPATTGGSVTLASPTTANSLIFNAFTGTYTLGTSGQILTLTDGINKTASSAIVTFVSPITLNGDQTWTNSSAGILTTGNGTNLITNNGYQLTVDGTGDTTFGVVNNSAVTLSGTGAIVKNGSGVLAIGGDNSAILSGDVTFNGGILYYGDNPGSLGSGNLKITDGVIESRWSTGKTWAQGTGPGQIQITGGESGFALNGNTSVTFDIGPITWGSATFAPTKFLLQTARSQQNSNVTISSAINLNGANRTIVVESGTTGAARATLSGAISNSTGTAGLIKEGAGMLNLTNNSSAWNGTTTINGGVLDLGGINLNNIGGGSGRNISVAEGAGVRFNALSNAILNRIVNTDAEITVMTATTSNNLDFSSNTGANLPNAFLGNWASNVAKAEISGTITPASDAYRFGSSRNSGLLGITNTSNMTGSQGLIIGGGSVELVGPKTFTGDTIIRNGARLGLAAIAGGNGVALALQNSALDTGSPANTGTIWFERGDASSPITGSAATTSAVFGGLIGSRNLATVYSTTTGANNSAATALANITGFTLNPGASKSHSYSGAIADFATGTTLTKTGAGIQILSGANTYTGATTISGGKLVINGSLSNVNAALTVQSGGTLGGNGTVGRNVTIDDGGKLEFDISTPPANHNRLDISTGRAFAFFGASELTITTSGGASPGTYTLITGGNNITGSAPATINLPSGWAATTEISGNSLLLNVTSVDGGVAGSLAVAGADGLITSGFAGGPFSPSTIEYTLSNPGDFSINWTAGKTAAWLDLSATSGTLAPGANTTVTVSINSAANSLSAGSYNDTVTFSNTSNGNGNTTRSVSLTANALATYAISYNGNGNTGGAPPSDQTKTQDVDAIIANPGTLVRTGHTFTGWNTAANGSGTAYAAGATYTANASVTLYAQWSANTYTVTFNPNGGDAPTPHSKEVTFDATYGTLATVSRTGYTFDGWFTAASGGNEVTAATTVATAADHTLHAQWTLAPVSVVTDVAAVDIPEGGTETFQVKLSAQPAENITVTVARSSGDTDITVQSGGSLTFTTSNWDTYQTVTLAAAVDTDAENGTAIITCEPSDPAYTAAEVTATELDKDTILTVASGGNGSTTPSGAVVVEKGVATAISATPAEGYDFVNWTVTNAAATLADDNAASTTATLSEPATVQANFAIKQYTLTYSAGTGGTLTGTSPQTVEHGADGTQVTAVPNAGYSFVKWSDDVLTASRTDTAVTGNLNVSAEFAPNTYTVTFHANGGDTPVPATKEVTFDAAYGTLATTARTGYSFNGWFTAAEGGTEITAATTVAIAGNHTLHARWTPDTYVVTFDGNGNTSGNPPTPQEKIHDVALTIPGNTDNLVKTGFTFSGWNTEADGTGTDYPAGSSYTANAPLTLYAKWSEGVDLYWSGDGSAQGGTGNWDTTNTRWGVEATGLFSEIWKSGNSSDRAIFGGTVGTVTLQEPISVGGITFNTAAYSITGNTLTLASGTVIHSTAGTSNSTDPVITSELAGTNGFTKTGTGWLGLEATTSSLSGDIKIQEGTLYTRHEALGSGNKIEFTGNSSLIKVYNANSNFTQGISINDGVMANMGASTFYYNANFAGALAGGTTSKLTLSQGGNTEFQFNNTANTFAGELTINGGGTADNGSRAVFRSLADSSQKIIINNALLRSASGGEAMNFTNRQLEILNNARLDNDSGNTMSFSKDLIATIGNNARTLILSGTNTGNNTFSGVIANSATGSGAVGLQKLEAGKWILGNNNTYTGKTDVRGGTLEIASLKNLDTNSSIGKNNDLQLGFFNTAGTLSYVGGETSTNRPVQINDYTSGTGNTGSGIILNNGSGALTFTAPTFIPTNEVVVANRSLELGGSYSATPNEIQGVIQDIAPVAGKAIISVVKRNDASTWILSGSNTYTGTTTVSAGKLFINGDQSNATGNVSVAANATLGGTGTIGGNTTIAANGRLEFDLGTAAASHDKLELAATRTLTFSGASVLTITSSGGAAPGTYTLVTAPGGITGSAPATLNLPADWEATVAIDGNSLVLNVTSTGSGPGPVASFAISGVPSQTTSGVALTGITITALDEFGATATAFSGTVTYGGTAGVTGTSPPFANGMLGGISITPSLIGSGRTFTVEDAEGKVGLAVLNVVTSSFQQWAEDNNLDGGSADLLAAPAGDGVTNLQKFAFGMDPGTAGAAAVTFIENGEVTGGMPTVWLRESTNNSVDYRAVFSRRKDHVAAGLRYTFQFSTDLGGWVSRDVTPTVISNPESESDIEAVSVPYPMFIQTPDGYQKPKFFRVGVSME